MSSPPTAPDPRTTAAIEADRSTFLVVPPLVDSTFVADRAQEEAREAIRRGDTILIAPTGYGKSWVAYEAAREVVESGGRVYYTTPLKALSNQKLDDLIARFGPERVGIVTGDRRERPSAPVLVLTTEILRAMLLSGDPLAPVDAPVLIVLDECHWLADPDRGTVWEEVILLAPRPARLLLLSASIGNGEQITAWLAQVRGQAPALIGVTDRAVEQRWGAWSAGAIVSLGQAIASGRASGGSPHWTRIVGALKSDRLTPALVFLPTRRDCDSAVNQCLGMKGVAVRSHHAGLSLDQRFGIEHELRDGVLDVVFCTTTLASGIDAPVKTVVLGSLVDGRDEPLSWTTLQQMAGRAGRRGRDSVGFVIVLARTLDDARWIERQRLEQPSHVDSAFRPGYQTVLRLVADLGPARARDFACRSFASFQNVGAIAVRRSDVARLTAGRNELLAALQPRACADPLVTWSGYMEWEKRALAGGRQRDEVRRLRQGYLCAHGIAFARDTKRDSRALILTSRGTIEDWPHLPPAQTVTAEDEQEVQAIVRELLSAPAQPPALGHWVALGTVDSSWSVQQVHVVTSERVSFGGEGSYLASRLIGKRVHTLQPAQHSSRVADLLERARVQTLAAEAESESDGNAFPCPGCPARSICPGTVARLAVVAADLATASRGLAGVAPDHRISLVSGVLRALGALDDSDRMTEVGGALLATNDAAGLFFAVHRKRLASLSPKELALVVAATRDSRVGYGRPDRSELPSWYLAAVQGAVKLEARAGGFGTLATLSADAESWGPRRAAIMEGVWNGASTTGSGSSLGDVERLVRETVATLNNLRGITELSDAARDASMHLGSITVRTV